MRQNLVGNGLDRSVVESEASALNLGSVKTEPYGCVIPTNMEGSLTQ